MKESHAKRIFILCTLECGCLHVIPTEMGLKINYKILLVQMLWYPHHSNRPPWKFSHIILYLCEWHRKREKHQPTSDYIHTSYMGSRRLARAFSSSTIFTYKYANLTKSKAFKLQFVKYYVGNRTKPNQTKCETVECGAKCLWLFHLLISFSKSFESKSVNSNENEVCALW